MLLFLSHTCLSAPEDDTRELGLLAQQWELAVAAWALPVTLSRVVSQYDHRITSHESQSQVTSYYDSYYESRTTARESCSRNFSAALVLCLHFMQKTSSETVWKGWQQRGERRPS